MKRVLADPEHVFKESLFTGEVAEAMPGASRDDMPDRVVAATVLSLAVPRLSRDGRIRVSTVDTIWQLSGVFPGNGPLFLPLVLYTKFRAQ